VNPSDRNLSASQAAARLGVSGKALRLYEQHGLLAPGRTRAGWRAYAPAEMARAAEIVALRALGLSLAQVGRVLGGEGGDLDAALAAHEARLQAGARQIAERLDRVRRLRSDLAGGRTPAPGALAEMIEAGPRLAIGFDLPWPWGGERFELGDIPPLTYLTGPLGSGKTRLAMRLAESFDDGEFLGLERLADNGAAAKARLDRDAALKSRVERTSAWLVDDGACLSDALTALLVALEAETPSVLVVDMVEQELDQATQEALAAHLRLRTHGPRRLILLTRSSSILDLDAVGSGEAIIYCPANHSPPIRVAPWPASPGYEAVATCLASPEVRARTAGIIAWRPPGAPAQPAA
jgi:DNA-binding transcriptional MerR regulator